MQTWFFAGLAIFIPVALTFSTLGWLFNLVDSWLQPLLGLTNLPKIPGLGIVVSLALVMALGIIASNLLGRQLIAWGQELMLRLPVVKSVYGIVKQLTDAMFSSNKQAFQQVCVIEWPRTGMYTIGFVTGRMTSDQGPDLICVFVPPAPNPTAGWLLLLPEEEVRMVDMAVEEGLKVVISGGVFLPGATGMDSTVAAAASLAAQREEKP